VRIALKKLRYATELATEIVGGKVTHDLKILRRAQDTLGRQHDLQMLIEGAREVQAALTPPSVRLARSTRS
jgi:CHAD domain-containing protein